MLKETGLSVHATVVDVHDGDTATVEIRFRVPIRVRNLWCMELKEGEAGLSPRTEAQELLPINSQCIVFIPSKNPLLLMDSVSLGRMIGDIYTKDGLNFAEEMVKRQAGYSTKRAEEAAKKQEKK